ncbi:TetR/AcrR family transcriptional regulator [Cupriavidus sp. SIMBA_020]|uniref:TetR/AcrR family transcriptional regulator n=1 Tax=Cupriavidus sp. SIMBA_020 TaxID=3085766 RepID=UPI00397C1945
MGHSQASRKTTHARIVTIAARRFRMHGLRGIGVADIMQEAGLTVGGFYKHFSTREALVCEAMAEAFRDTDQWSRRLRADLRRSLRAYLGESHRDRLEDSCGIAAFLNDAGVSGVESRALYTTRLRQLVELIASLLPEDGSDRQAKAILIYSACVGALTLSRAVSDAELSRELLNTVADQLMALIATPDRSSAPLPAGEER